MIPGHKEPLGPASAVVLFDGICELCDKSIQFVIRHDPDGVFLFSPLQSEFAQNLIQRLNLDTEEFHCQQPSSFIVVLGGTAFFKSDAWLQILRRLTGPVRWLALFRFAPKILRDGVYSFVGDHRYEWFGKKSECMVPSPAVQRRFRFRVDDDRNG